MAKLNLGELDREVKEKVLADDEVLQFIDDNELTEQEIDHNIYKFAQFIKEKEIAHAAYKIVLEYSSGTVYIERYPIGQAGQRAKDGIKASYVCDRTTKPYKYIELSSIKVDKLNDPILKAFKRQVEQYKYKNTRGVWLYGNYGIGKTYLMGAVGNAFYKRGCQVKFINALEWTQAIKKELDYRANNINAMLESAKDAEILIIDDIGSEHTSEWITGEILYQVINARYDEDKTTFFTSNLSIQEYAEQNKKTIEVSTADRMTERLNFLAKEVRMLGHNRRENLNSSN